MFSEAVAPSRKADACEKHLVCLENIPWAEAEKIMLVFMILGWQVRVTGQDRSYATSDLFAGSIPTQSIPTQSIPMQSIPPICEGTFAPHTEALLAGDSGDLEHSSRRLLLRGGDRIISVTSADPALMPVLAAAGVDRLVMPVAIPAIEQLMVLAG